MLSVHNWGNPIPEDRQEKIFTRLYRIKNGKTNKGWGIGLSLVKGVAEAHGGSTSVRSNAHDGTTFTMCIPYN